MKNHLITVIVPVYNAEKEISRCLDSILKQTFFDFDILIINDGSTDGSQQIVDEYIKKNNQIRMVTIENSGVAYARQVGLLQATGKYLIFVDSDDYLSPDMINNLYVSVKENKCAAACCSFVMEEGNKRKEVHLDTAESVISSNELLYKYIVREFRGALWCWIFEKKVFDGFKFPVGSVLADDFAAIIYVLTHTKDIGVVHKIGYYYVQNATSLSRGGFTDRHINYFYNLQELKKQIVEFCPDLEKAVIWTFSINEMALITAMCKNHNLNQEIIKKVVQNLKKNLWIIVSSRKMPFLYKASAIAICISHKMFMKVYRFLLVVLRFDLNRFNLTLGQKNKVKEK